MRIPVALFGVLWFGFVLVCAALERTGPASFKDGFPAYLFVLSTVGLAVITTLLVIPPVQFFLPAAANKAPVTQPPAQHDDTDWTVRRALTNPAFWLLFIARTLASMGNQVIITHQIAHAIDVGFAKVFAASISGLMGVISIFGRLLFGYLSDVIRREVVFTWVQVISAFGIFALIAMRNDSQAWLLYAYAVCYGLGQGSRALVKPLLQSRSTTRTP